MSTYTMTLGEMMNSSLIEHIFPSHYEFYIDDEQFGWISRLLGKSHRPAIIFTTIPLAVSPEDFPTHSVALYTDHDCLASPATGY